MSTKAQDGGGSVLAIGTSTTLTLTSVANASGGTTVYTGTITGYAGFVGYYFAISGFVNGANNGFFLCTAATATTLTLANTGGIAETHAATAVPVPVIGEVQSIKQSGAKWDTEDSTNLQSSAKEFVGTVLDWGEFQVEAKRVSTDVGQVQVVAAFNSGALTSFTLTLPKEQGQNTNGDKYAFSAIVSECNTETSYNKLVPLTFKIKVSGAVTYTQGL